MFRHTFVPYIQRVHGATSSLQPCHPWLHVHCTVYSILIMYSWLVLVYCCAYIVHQLCFHFLDSAQLLSAAGPPAFAGQSLRKHKERGLLGTFQHHCWQQGTDTGKWAHYMASYMYRTAKVQQHDALQSRTTNWFIFYILSIGMISKHSCFLIRILHSFNDHGQCQFLNSGWGSDKLRTILL